MATSPTHLRIQGREHDDVAAVLVPNHLPEAGGTLQRGTVRHHKQPRLKVAVNEVGVVPHGATAAVADDCTTGGGGGGGHA